ncbi:MAG: TetR/AcrR family transcriptional regulator [Eggerthellaceae bacterium]|nr:TetR/AcrR family transcriptional regulator [Eggerthellaceae bacterium]
MAVADTSIDSRILKSAQAEFAAKTFKGASLRSICSEAGVTTGAFYKRYRNKEELFDAVVAPTLAVVDEYCNSVESVNYDHLDRDNMRHIWELTPETQARIVHMFYDHYEGFRLLLIASEGTKHVNFIHDFVEDVTKRSYKFIKEAHKRGIAPKVIDQEELHMLLTAYWATLFEPLVHGLSRKRALRHSEVVGELFDWTKVLGF